MMAEYWQNRITGESRTRPPEDVPLGIWVDSSHDPWLGQGDEAIGIGKHLLPDSILTNGVVRVCKNLREVDVERWRDWSEFLPVDAQLSEPPKLRKEEKVLLEAIQHFEEIARLPRAHLKVEEVRIPVGRARRFPPRALNVLASHSEDWHSRSFSSVRPNRVLSEVQDDDFAIYENRALKTLQQRLLSALTPRLSMLKSLRDSLDASELNQSGGRRFSIHRLCELLAELFTEDPSRAALDALIENLEALRMRLLSLEGMFLFKEIKFEARVSSPIQATNILRDDSHYRHVFHVWMAWEARSKKKVSRREELLKYPQALDQFTGLLCVRALKLLGMDTDEIDNSQFHPGSPSILLKHHWSLIWNPNGTLTFKHQDNTSTLHIIGTPTQLSRLPLAIVERMVVEIEAAAAKGDSILLVTLSQKEKFPESWPESLKLKLNTWMTKPAKVPSCFMAEVSAVKLNSVELIARILRRIIAEHDWPSLPISIALEERFSTLFPEFSKDVSKQWSRPPSNILLNRLEKSGCSLASELTRLGSELAQAQQDERATRSQKQKVKTNFEQLKHGLRKDITSLTEKNDIWSAMFKQIQEVDLSFKPALSCPCCGYITTNPPVGSAYSCSSDSCKTEWGRQHNHSVFLHPDGDDPTITREDPILMFGADYI